MTSSFGKAEFVLHCLRSAPRHARERRTWKGGPPCRAVAVSARSPRQPPRPRARSAPDGIFARLQEGWSYDEIGREEGVTASRIRQIVKQALDKREVDASRDTRCCRSPASLRRCGWRLRRSARARSRRSRRCLRCWSGSTNTGRRARRPETSDYEEGGREKLLHKLNFMAERMLQEREARGSGGGAGGRRRRRRWRCVRRRPRVGERRRTGGMGRGWRAPRRDPPAPRGAGSLRPRPAARDGRSAGARQKKVVGRPGPSPVMTKQVERTADNQIDIT